MTEFADILTGSIDLKRQTAFLLDEVANAASYSADRQPIKASRLEVVVDGATVSTGLVNVSGNVNETFSFSEDGKLIGTQDFTSISGITTSGIEDGFLSIKAITKLGQPINQDETIYSDLPIRFYAQNGRIRMMKQGQEKIAKYKIMADWDKDIQENDLLFANSGVFGLTIGRIDFAEKIFDFDGATHHTEAEVMEL